MLSTTYVSRLINSIHYKCTISFLRIFIPYWIFFSVILNKISDNESGYLSSILIGHCSDVD